MRKWIVALILFLLLSLGACRPIDHETPGEAPDLQKSDIAQTGTPIEGETGTPTETHECTYTEDPELRAQAEQLSKGSPEYYEFCIKNDLKIYRSLAETENFETQKLSVVLRRNCSAPQKAAPDFSCVDPISVTDETPDYTSIDDYRQIFTIIIKGTTKKDLVDAFEKLQEHPCVLMVEEFGYYDAT